MEALPSSSSSGSCWPSGGRPCCTLLAARFLSSHWRLARPPVLPAARLFLDGSGEAAAAGDAAWKALAMTACSLISYRTCVC
uniref:Uncharacterized protein n=1 Tax=Arundo donax TaxID=35708 RepID=A0A0A9CDV7_ARUDO